MKTLLSILLLSFIFSMEGKELAIAMEERLKPKDIKSKNTMVLTDSKHRKRTLELISSSKDDSEKQMIWFLQPAKNKGTAFLKIEHEDKDDFMTMWLPGFRDFKRIRSSNKSDSFMGSDLSFEDLTNRDIKDYVYNILKIDSCNYNDISFDCFELESVANDISSEYSKHITWVLEIEKDVFIPIKEHSFDEEGNLLKIKKIDFEKMDEYYIMHRLEVENVQEDHSTLLTVNDISLNNNFDDAMFIQRNLKIIPN